MSLGWMHTEAMGRSLNRKRRRLMKKTWLEWATRSKRRSLKQEQSPADVLNGTVNLGQNDEGFGDQSSDWTAVAFDSCEGFQPGAFWATGASEADAIEAAEEGLLNHPTMRGQNIDLGCISAVAWRGRVGPFT